MRREGAVYVTAFLLYFAYVAASDRHQTITRECLERFFNAYSDRFAACRECFQASEDENASDSIWDCCNPQGKNCGEIFPHLQFVVEPCTEEDKKALHLEELKETGSVWGSMCEQVNAEPIKNYRPPPPSAPSAEGGQIGGAIISLNVPPSPPLPEDGDQGSDMDRSDTHVTCTPALPEDSPDICLVYGDPHVIGFGYEEGSMHTCDVADRVELLSNQFISVMAETQHLSQSVSNTNALSGVYIEIGTFVPCRGCEERILCLHCHNRICIGQETTTVDGMDRLLHWDVTGASILTSLTISYKNGSCGSDQAISSATKWEDARLQTSVTVNEGTLQSGQKFLSATIATPFISGATGWCTGGCPENEVPTQAAGPSRKAAKRRLLQGSEGDFDRVAFEACKAEGLQGDFLVACAFDSTYSGDRAFVASAARDAAEYTAAKYGEGDVQASKDTTAKTLSATLTRAVAVWAFLLPFL